MPVARRREVGSLELQWPQRNLTYLRPISSSTFPSSWFPSYVCLVSFGVFCVYCCLIFGGLARDWGRIRVSGLLYTKLPQCVVLQSVIVGCVTYMLFGLNIRTRRFV